MGITPEKVTLLLVALHMLDGLAKTLFHTPKQQAQIDTIESKLDGLGRQLQAVAK